MLRRGLLLAGIVLALGAISAVASNTGRICRETCSQHLVATPELQIWRTPWGFDGSEMVWAGIRIHGQRPADRSGPNQYCLAHYRGYGVEVVVELCHFRLRYQYRTIQGIQHRHFQARVQAVPYIVEGFGHLF